MALLAAMVLVGINETGHMRSQDAVEQLAQGLTTRADVNKLLQSMLDAETGLRGRFQTGPVSHSLALSASYLTRDNGGALAFASSMASAIDLEM